MVYREAALTDDDTAALLEFYGGCFGATAGLAGRVLVHRWAVAGGEVHRFAVDGATMPGWTPLGDVDWTWQAEDRDGGLVGEYADESGAWTLSGAAWLPPADGEPDDVQLVPPDPTWPDQAATLIAELGAIVPAGLVRRWEHYGSTAVPDLPAKPVLDLLAEVEDEAAARQALVPALCGRAVEYWRQDGAATYVGRWRWGGRRRYHLHVAAVGDPIWAGLTFRDRLRADAALRREYAALKADLAATLGADRERYTLAKGEFVARYSA